MLTQLLVVAELVALQFVADALGPVGHRKKPIAATPPGTGMTAYLDWAIRRER